MADPPPRPLGRTAAGLPETALPRRGRRDLGAPPPRPPRRRAVAKGLARPIAGDLVARNRQDLEIHPGVAAYMGGEQAAFLVGESGLLLLRHSLGPSDDVANALHALLAGLVGDVRGLVWGGAGAMLAAIFMHERTGEDRWANLYAAHFDALWQSWVPDEASGAWLWEQDLYGVKERRLGALHGFMANATAMLRGRNLIEPDRFAEARSRILQTVHATAVDAGRPDQLAARPGRRAGTHARPALHGRARDDHRLGRAGRGLRARRAPSPKPANWSGRPGRPSSSPASATAFQEAASRSSSSSPAPANALWLARSRAFAMHAIEQGDRAGARFGQRIFSLWFGDVGLAVYLLDCIEATAQFPTLDVF